MSIFHRVCFASAKGGITMPVYIMFGKYSHAGKKEISSERTQGAVQVIGGSGGEVKAGYALFGETDLVIITEFIGNDQDMKSSVRLSQLLGISFTTAPAVSMEDFDKLVG